MNDRTRLKILAVMILVSSVVFMAVVIHIGIRYGKIAEIESAEVFTEKCLLLPMIGFITVTFGCVVVPMLNRCRTIMMRLNGKEYELDESNFVPYIAVFGLTMPLAILYSEYADPFMFGNDTMLASIIPFGVQIVLYEVIYRINRFQRRNVQ